MKSMTGFGHAELRDQNQQMVLELRSYNNRYLELTINLPYALKQLEPRVREWLSSGSAWPAEREDSREARPSSGSART